MKKFKDLKKLSKLKIDKMNAKFQYLKVNFNLLSLPSQQSIGKLRDNGEQHYLLNFQLMI